MTLRPHSSANIASKLEDLPTEVLRLIFLEYLAQYPTSRLKLTRDAAPLIFLHVCRWWREVANDFSDLWEALDIELPDSAFKDKGMCTSIAHALKGKSEWIRDLRVFNNSLQPMDILGDRVTPRVLREVLAPVLHTGTRLTTLRLDSVTISELDRLSSGSFASLHSLTLNMDQVSRDEVLYTVDKKRVGGAGSLRVLENMPKLDTLRLSRQAIECFGMMGIHTFYTTPGMDSVDAFVNLPWSQLIHIEDTGIYGTRPTREKTHLEHEHFLNGCLAKCERLETLKLTVSADDVEYQWKLRDQVPTHPSALAKLRSLTLDYTYNRRYQISNTRFQVLFACPNLKGLTLIARGSWNGTATEPFLLHLRTLKTVEHLHLDLAGPYEVTYTYLTYLPNVKTLSVCHDTTADDETHSDRDSELDPVLKPEWMCQGCPLEVLAGVAYDLRKPVPCLETLVVDWDVPDCSVWEPHPDKLVKLMTAIQDAETKIGVQGGWVRRIVLQSWNEEKVVKDVRRLMRMGPFEGRFEVVGQVKEALNDFLQGL